MKSEKEIKAKIKEIDADIKRQLEIIKSPYLDIGLKSVALGKMAGLTNIKDWLEWVVR